MKSPRDKRFERDVGKKEPHSFRLSEKEVDCLRVNAKKTGRSPSSLIAHLLTTLDEGGPFVVNVVTTVELARKALFVARKLGYDSIEEWIEETLKRTVNEKYNKFDYF